MKNITCRIQLCNFNLQYRISWSASSEHTAATNIYHTSHQVIKLRTHDKHWYVIIWNKDYLSWMKFLRREVWMPSISSLCLWQRYMKMGNTTGHRDRIKTKFRNFRVKAGNIWMREQTAERPTGNDIKNFFHIKEIDRNVTWTTVYLQMCLHISLTSKLL